MAKMDKNESMDECCQGPHDDIIKAREQRLNEPEPEPTYTTEEKLMRPQTEKPEN